MLTTVGTRTLAVIIIIFCAFMILKPAYLLINLLWQAADMQQQHRQTPADTRPSFRQKQTLACTSKHQQHTIQVEK